MDARFYHSEEIDIERLANDLVNVYQAQGYQAQQFGNKDRMLVQLKKGGDFEALIGMQAALSLTIQRTAGGVLAMVGSQKWLDKAAVGAVGLAFLWPLALTAGAGAWRQASLANQALNMVDGLVRQQRPEVQMGPVPVQIMPQVQQQYLPPPGPYYVPSQPVTVSPVPPPALPAPAPTSTATPKTTLPCPNCNTPYEEGNTFCPSCGRSLKQPKTYCPNCHTELKPNASFCPDCGASTFQTVTQTAQPAPQSPAPTYTPPQTPVYTPPALNASWGTLVFADGQQFQLTDERAVVGRYDHDLAGIEPEVDLGMMPGGDTVSRIHAALEHIGSTYTLMDLNSTNSTRLNGKRLEPDKATPIKGGDTLTFGKVTCTFKKT